MTSLSCAAGCRNASRQCSFNRGTLYLFPESGINRYSVPLFPARPLVWYEYMWLAWPVLLIFVGGLVGAICGLVAMNRNAHIFCSDRSVLVKYLLTGLISCVAILVFVVVAVVIQLTFGI
jgi:hypothetical protein